MNIRETVKAFAAMDANGQPFTILKGTMLSSVGDGCGFNGRIDEIATVASFVYFGVVEVTLPKRAHNPLLLAADFGQGSTPIPWWDGRRLVLKFR